MIVVLIAAFLLTTLLIRNLTGIAFATAAKVLSVSLILYMAVACALWGLGLLTALVLGL